MYGIAQFPAQCGTVCIQVHRGLFLTRYYILRQVYFNLNKLFNSGCCFIILSRTVDKFFYSYLSTNSNANYLNKKHNKIFRLL